MQVPPLPSAAARLVAALILTVAAPRAPAADSLPPVICSARSGMWSAATTWEGGKVPAAEARVLIRTGHRVVYDVKSHVAIHSINVAGILTFDPDCDTRLDVGLVVIRAGEEYSESGFDCEAHAGKPDPAAERPALEVGTPNRPIGPKHTALIRLCDGQGLDRESCPAIVCCGGRMDFHGQPMSRTWVKLGAKAGAGGSNVTLAEAVILLGARYSGDGRNPP